ncbi:MAG: bifunctional diaminohydroxyphosphoribosylaminopyrimidine deaminase/5-amino-6-(5-phosphoribosylamino)uracil reductase RibD [Nitrospirae bacterium]|nr:bifunctional diaminohydroxyphosphoribosylaminopyrimidine deaminase/5-amino-6-(5-phosphoribosylamino)uracil reductase RibD [Nitrospirota bacterium]MBF0534116.1 bifunctional diaminohydroxyphosphoribosylaminopyrimidine deaminase/5-amino-6-(5-phosphoribosylamino)uracil reductase RibD [Nitrospirota bacterium]MBF0617003.1 bifunctional diaminohydroxyphosphoribosylaminopyrimidine deaminase/5-amino-6-(5-phosphoribosylamino)uracil reductase RibD [Nitrospirota bacterium]
MKRCLRLAARAVGKTSPNPMVGALLYKDGRVIAEAYHKKAGTPHAEPLAIDKAGEQARGSTLFVTLEPCCHTGKRTPPCTERIISAGIKDVCIAMLDPNPKVAGNGVRILNNHGIKTEVGIVKEQALALNEFYIKYITTGLPFVILKSAMTLDGKTATPDGVSKWISSEKSRYIVHRLRSSVDAVVTAIGTVKADNPRLTARIKGGKNPIRVVIDPQFETPPDFNVMATPPKTIFVTRTGGIPETRPQGDIDYLCYESSKVDMSWLMAELGRREITSVLIEGGSSLAGYAVSAGVVDKIMVFVAPKIVGGPGVYTPVGGKTFLPLDVAHQIYGIKSKKIGTDLLIEGYFNKKL